MGFWFFKSKKDEKNKQKVQMPAEPPHEEERAGSLWVDFQTLGTSHERRQELLPQIVQKALAEGPDSGWAAESALYQLLCGGYRRDLAQVRQWGSQLPDEDDRSRFLDTMDELEDLGLAEAGDDAASLRAFLLKAARAGSEAAGRHAYETIAHGQNTDPEVMEAVAYAALHGGLDCISIMESATCKEGNIDIPRPQTAHEHAFWRKLYYEVFDEEAAPFEDLLARWQEVRRQDAQAVAKKRGAMQALLDKRDALEARVQALEGTEGREAELLEAFCSLLIARDKAALFAKQNEDWLEKPVPKLHTLFTYPDGREPDDWEPPAYDPDAVWAYAQGRVLEQKSTNYPKVVELYREAARLGHGEAMYRLSSLGEFWPEAAKPYKREEWARKIRAAGWPLTGSWMMGNYLISDSEYRDDPSGLLELARDGDLDAVRHLTEFFQDRWRSAKGTQEEPDRYREAMLMTKAELALNRKAAEDGDNEACLHLYYLYRDRDDELWKRGETSRRQLAAIDKDLQEKRLYWHSQVFQRKVPLIYYRRAIAPYGLSDEAAQKAAEYAEAMGLVGALAGLEEWRRGQREIREYDRREAAAQKEAARRRRERRDALEAEMDAYRSQLDWAERGINLAAHGRDDTMVESYLRGDTSLQDSARADFVRSELESAHRRKLEDAYRTSGDDDEDE